jgi:hypothetical protein
MEQAPIMDGFTNTAGRIGESSNRRVAGSGVRGALGFAYPPD